MGARFSEMQDDERDVLVQELYDFLIKLLKPTKSSEVFMRHGVRASVIIFNVLVFADSGTYNRDALCSQTPTLAGLGDVVILVEYFTEQKLFDLFGEVITIQIKRSVHRLWMIYLLNNILTDEEATSERVEQCRMMLAREIVRRVCEGDIAYLED